MTKSHGSRAMAVVISSTMPSTKYSCSASPVMFWNGSTANDGLSGSGNAPSLTLPRKRGRVREGAFLANPEHPHRPADVFELLFADILEGDIEFLADLVAHDPADADATGIGQTLEAGGQIHSVAEDVAILGDDVALMNTDAELDAVGGRDLSVALCHHPLHLDRTA